MNKLNSEYIFEIANSKRNKAFFEQKTIECQFDITKTSFEIDKKLEKKLNREAGHYVCFNYNDLLIFDLHAKEYFAELLEKEINVLLKTNNIKPKKVLIVGLGNPKYACDSLGKLVCDRVLVTTPYLDKKLYSPKQMARIYSVSLGVYGTTGIDSASLVKSVCELIEPDVVVAIDSLVASQTKNLARSVQISDTRLSPGGGVGNVRQDIGQDVVGAKVFAIGVPLVANMKSGESNLIVTPKDIEKQVSVISKIIATAINKTFTNLSKQEYLQLVSWIFDV